LTYDESISGYSGELLVNTDVGYIYSKEGKRTYYVFSTYTSAATFNNEGAPVLLTIVRKGKKAKYSFPLKNEEGTVETISKTIKKNIIKDGTLKEVFEEVFNAISYLEGVKDNKLLKTTSEWSDLLSKHTISDNDYDSAATYYAYGVIEGVNNTKLYKIYPNIVKVSEFKDEEIPEDIVLEYEYSGSVLSSVTLTLDFEFSGGEKSITVKKGDFNSWNAEYDDERNKDWCRIYDDDDDKPSEIYSSFNDTFTLKVLENTSTEPRTCTIGFKYKDSEPDATIDINQNGKEPGHAQGRDRFH
jgi:hypothetical protein